MVSHFPSVDRGAVKIMLYASIIFFIQNYKLLDQPISDNFTTLFSCADFLAAMAISIDFKPSSPETGKGASV